MLGILCGCSLGKSYREIDPEGAEADMRKNNGYYALKSVTPGKAKIVFRSEGMPYDVNFSTSTSSVPCQDFKIIGDVKDSGHGIIYPWIANLTGSASRNRPFIANEAPPGQSIQIRGYGAWIGDVNNGFTRGKCGPLVSRFTPVADHAYLVQFRFVDGGCKQVISDASNPDSPIPLPVEHIQSCSKP